MNIKRKFNILGHANAALTILLDSLYSMYGDQLTVDIINNIPPEQNDFIDMEYAHANIETQLFQIESWVPREMKDFILGGMSPKTKQAIFRAFQDAFGITAEMFTEVRHNTAILSNSAVVGFGCNIGPGVVVAPYVKIGNFVTLNRNVSIGHHTVLEDFCTVNPGVNISGLCCLGKGAQVGVGSSIIDQMTIGENAFVGAGSVVTRNIPPNTIAYGVPARVVRSRD